MPLKVSSHSTCRVCGGLLEVMLDLGDQALSGIFPKPGDLEWQAPLMLSKCRECELVQLVDTVDPYVLFNEYGYRSGMNHTMTQHLKGIVAHVAEHVQLYPSDVVLDIGANDGTLLAAYPKMVTRIGFEPAKIEPIHPYQRIPEFFSASRFLSETQGQLAKVVTAIAMFYDLEEPIKFCQDVASILAPEGVFVLEVAYLPKMLDNVAFDAVCHEHLTYYMVKTLRDVLQLAGFSIGDVDFNESNGGSVRIVANRRGLSDIFALNSVLAYEQATLTPARYDRFGRDVKAVIRQLKDQLAQLRDNGYTIFGYGASTKGNVLLQACQLDRHYIEAIADKNPLKWDRVTPGTHIPIWPEQAVRDRNPNVLLILPWAFVKEFIAREAELIKHGTSILIPLPKPHYLTANDLRE